MADIIVLDWYTSKYVKVSQVTKEVLEKLTHLDKVIYHLDGSDWSSLTVWEYVAFDVDTDRLWRFENILQSEDEKYFTKQQAYADEVFPLFKKTFKKNFKWSIPVTARFQIFSNQLYFYFYAEERYIFSDYVRELRSQLGRNIFLFQVGARDMVRLYPCAKDYLTVDGRPLHASMYWPLPSVAMDNIVLQNLDGRDVERLKGWSWKLKESMIYEASLYQEEAKKYPTRGQEVRSKSKDEPVSWICLSYNIMSWDVTIKTKDSGILRLPVSQLDFGNKK